MSMRKPSDLSQWIEGLANDGQWESEGVFTVEQSKAWEKLAGYQLPTPDSWVLKLVQSAVLSRTTELRVVQTGSETRFQFLGQTSWSEAEVAHALFSTGPVSDQGLIPLAVAIRYLAGKARKLLALIYPQGQAQVWDGERFRTQGFEESVPYFQLVVFSAEKEEGGWLLGSIVGTTEMAAIAGTLSQLAYTCPIPLSLDGRSLNGFNHDPDAGVTSRTCPFAMLTSPEELHLPSFRFLRDRDRKRDSAELQLRLRDEAMDPDQLELRCGLLMALSACTEEVAGPNPHFASQPSFLVWLKDGVIVNKEVLPARGAVGVTILVSGEGIRTDLAGLTLARDKVLEARRKAALRRARARLRELGKQDFRGALKFSMRGGTHKKAIVAFAGLALIKPIFLGAVGLAAAQYASDKLRLRRRENQLQDDLQALCDMF